MNNYLKISFIACFMFLSNAKRKLGKDSYSNHKPNTIVQSVQKSKIVNKVMNKLSRNLKKRDTVSIGHIIRDALVGSSIMGSVGYPISYILSPGRTKKNKLGNLFDEIKIKIKNNRVVVKERIKSLHEIEDFINKIEKNYEDFKIDFSLKIEEINAIIQRSNLKQTNVIKEYLTKTH